MRKRHLYPLLAVFYGAISGFALANPQQLQEASQALCETMRQCTLARMEQEQMTPQMRQMVEGMIANMCTQIVTAEKVTPYHELIEPATECLRSMAELPCDAFEQEPQTPACNEFDALAEKYGVER